MIKNRVIKNASWIIACRIVQSLLGLVVAMLTARYLGPSNYGLINYAASITAFVTPIMQLGLNNVLVQEIVHNKNEEGIILGTSLFLSILSSVLCIIGISCFAFIANANEQTTIIVCILYSITLFFQALELTQYWFQAKLLSKYTSIVSLIAYCSVSAYKIFLLATAKSIYWFAVSNAIDYLLISVTILIIYKKLNGQKLVFKLHIAKRLLAKSHYYILSSLMVTVFAQTDKIMLKFMLDNSSTGFYSAAVTCAGLTSFIFVAIIDSARPSIFSSQMISKGVFESNIVTLYSVIIYFALFQSLIMAVLSELIVQVLYGSDYLNAVSALRIVVWYTTFSYLGSVRNIWMLAENKQKYLLSINLMGALSNIVLNAILIPVMGIEGAAIASLITQFFTNVITGYIIRDIRHNNELMIKGLDPKNLLLFYKRIHKS